MADLIKELDHGLSPLPAGSEVVFVNTHNPDDTLGAVLQNTSLDFIKVRPSHGITWRCITVAYKPCRTRIAVLTHLRGNIALLQQPTQIG
jgi:hypothetical protein